MAAEIRAGLDSAAPMLAIRQQHRDFCKTPLNAEAIANAGRGLAWLPTRAYDG